MTGQVAIAAAGDAGQPLVIKRSPIAASSSGDNTLVAAVSGKKIRVLALLLVIEDAVAVRFESGAGGSALTGVMDLASPGVQLILPWNPCGWFETVAGQPLNLELSAPLAVNGCLVYVEV